MKRILVTGAGGPAGVNFTLSLKLVGRREVYIVGAEANKYHIHMAKADKVYLTPKAEEKRYIDTINRIIAEEDVELVYPQPDIEVQVISENREKISAKVFLPSKNTIRICQDKLKTVEVLEKKGVPVPETIEVKGEDDLKKAFEELKKPIWIRATRGAGGKGSTPASSLEVALAWIRYWKLRDEKLRFIAQEYLPGRNLAFHALFRDGELITSMARERVEYIYPSLSPSGITGTPAVQRTIHSEKVNRIAEEAVLAIDPNYNGIASVDLKEDVEGIPRITEINPGRTFTTSFFFSYAGKLLYRKLSMPVSWFANIPYLYLKVAYGESLPPLKKYNILPANIYWIRHIDIPGKILIDGKIAGEMYRMWFDD